MERRQIFTSLVVFALLAAVALLILLPKVVFQNVQNQVEDKVEKKDVQKEAADEGFLFEELSLNDTMQSVIERHRSKSRIGADLPPFNMKEKTSMKFDPWIEDYIAFHKSAMIGQDNNGDHFLKDDARYVVYQCTNGEILCGGAGDRTIGMVKMFYWAMCTNRVLLIDADFPVKLDEVLNPSYIQWNVSYPITDQSFRDMDYDFSSSSVVIPKREDVKGYIIPDVQGIPRKYALREILNSTCMREHFVSKGWEREFSTRLTMPRAVHQAFWALFRFDPRVVNRSKEIQKASGLKGDYIGLHMRTGDKTLIHNGTIGHKYFHRTTGEKKLLSCYRLFQDEYPDTFQGGYLASDNEEFKTKISDQESTIHPSVGVNIFHIDLSTRTYDGTPPISDYESALDGTIDTWAEILALVDSLCLVIVSSMMDFTAYYIRGQEHCAVFLRECDQSNVRRPFHSYAAENIYQVKNFGLPIP